jgi:hypothetical protein
MLILLKHLDKDNRKSKCCQKLSTKVIKQPINENDLTHIAARSRKSVKV